MPNWNQILDEIKASGSTHDIVRRKYLNKLQRITGRNVIIYYSGWLQKREAYGVQVITSAIKHMDFIMQHTQPLDV